MNITLYRCLKFAFIIGLMVRRWPPSPAQSIPVVGGLPVPDVPADCAKVPGQRGDSGGEDGARQEGAASSSYNFLSQQHQRVRAGQT